MKKSIPVVLVFLLSFLIFALVKIPASVAVSLAQASIPSHVQLGALQGTLWKGIVSEVRVNGQTFHNIRWDLNGWALLTGNLAGKIRFGEARNTQHISGFSDFKLNVFSQAISLKETRVRVAIEQAIRQLNLPLPINAKGRIIVDLNDYTSGKPYCEALSGEISSPNIDVKGMSNWFSVGDLSGTLSCKSGGVALNIAPGNLLGLQADLTLAGNYQFKVAGNIKPDASLPKEVHDAVKFLGRPDNEGRYPINL